MKYYLKDLRNMIRDYNQTSLEPSIPYSRMRKNDLFAKAKELGLIKEENEDQEDEFIVPLKKNRVPKSGTE